MLDVLMNFDPALLLAFIGAGLLLNLTPGADFLLVTSSGIRGGPHVGRAAAFGVNLGILVHVTMAAAGLSALLIAYPASYDIIRYAGAAYLIWIAWVAWNDTGELAEGKAELTQIAALKRGFLTNVLNPKTALFIFAFIPQFTTPENGPMWQQILILGLIFAINGFVFVLILGTASGHLGPILRRFLRPLNRVTAILFGGLAARLVFD